MGRTTTIAIADDHRLVIDAVEAALAVEEEFEIVGTAASGDELLSLLEWARPDVVLLDISMPGKDGLHCLEQLRVHHPRIKVVVLSGHDDPRVAHDALRLGASAFIRKDLDPRDLGAVLRQTVEETVISQLADVQRIEDEVAAARAKLTKSELSVLEALSRGRLNGQIAEDLSVAPQTVKFHLTNIYRKLGVANRTEAIRYAYEHGFVSQPSSMYAGVV